MILDCEDSILRVRNTNCGGNEDWGVGLQVKANQSGRAAIWKCAGAVVERIQDVRDMDIREMGMCKEKLDRFGSNQQGREHGIAQGVLAYIGEVGFSCVVTC